MAQRTVLKVDITCLKCKKKLLKAVTGLEGVDKIEVDAAKGTLTVTGNADPYDIIVRCRKAGKFAEVVTVGPPPAPTKPKEDEKKKQEEKKPVVQKDQLPYYMYQPHIIMMQPPCYEPNPSCSIM
ncbi:hypothetical protein ACLB2K_005766 [Fragaria x ananassa]